ncbi:MAG: cupin domain-containing protein [Halanaeroarchaeum sp.]
MRRVTLDDLESRMGPADVAYALTESLQAADVAINYYELAPGDSFSYGLHAHADQEEVFYVQSGTVTFHLADGEMVVQAGDLVRFPPGEYQRGVNEGDERVVALAIGAPQDPGETDVRRTCPECGTRTSQSLELADDRSEIRTVCEDCGTVTGRFD